MRFIASQIYTAEKRVKYVNNSKVSETSVFYTSTEELNFNIGIGYNVAGYVKVASALVFDVNIWNVLSFPEVACAPRMNHGRSECCSPALVSSNRVALGYEIWRARYDTALCTELKRR